MGSGLSKVVGAATAVVSPAAGAILGPMFAAKAQGDIAEAQLNQQRNDRELALSYAEPTPQELAQIQRSISLNELDIARKQKLIESSDPALIEAGQQALKLLKGEEAKTLAPLKANIDKQESALRAKLQAQLGPGYENTTAGIQALQAFNEQANGAMAGAQQSALGALLGTAQDTSSRYGTQSNIANSSALASMFGNINNRKISAINGTPITAAGAQFVGDLQAARGMGQAFSQGTQLAGIFAGGGFGKTAASGGGGGDGGIGTGGYVQSANNNNPYAMNS